MRIQFNFTRQQIPKVFRTTQAFSPVTQHLIYGACFHSRGATVKEEDELMAADEAVSVM